MTTGTEATLSSSDAVRDRLAGDLGFAGLLSIHDGAPACFAHGLVPADVGLPFCVVGDPTVDKPADTKTTEGRDITIPVSVFTGPGLGTDATSIAEAARAVLHRSPVDVAPYTAWMTDAEGPIPIGGGVTRTGRAIRVRIGLST